MSSTIHPIVLTVIIAAIVAIVAAIFAFRASRIIPRACLAVISLVAALPALWCLVALYPELVDVRFRAYKTFYKEIQEGMSRDEVFALLDHRYPPSGSRKRPRVVWDDPGKLGFFMNPESSREPNCEGIFLTLNDGRVTTKGYSPD